ncbi:cytochrome P450 6k1-like isoform X2 [Bicyclus anynana]|nr:cytochrome P450 6k1-like isoform X2 [Bicyclus anynana]
MLQYILMSMAMSLVAWLYIKWVRVRSYWAERGVPHQAPVPLLGSLTFLQRENPGVWMRQLYTSNRPYVGIWLLWRPALVVNSPEIARRILVKDFANFRNRYLGSGDSDPVGALNLFSVNDPVWSSMRNRLSVIFTAAKLKMLQDYIGLKARELAQRIRNDIENPINLKSMFVDYTTDVIGTSAFGVESNATLTGEGPMRSITHDFAKFDLMRGLSWCCIFFFPDLVNCFRLKFFPKKSENYLREVFNKIVKHREQHATGIIEVKDLLDALIKVKKEKMENHEAISEDLLIAQAAVFLFAGFETSGSALSLITYELAFKPDIQEKVYRELKEAQERAGDVGDKDFDAKTLSELTYLNCCIKEGLRKYSPMGWLDRSAMTDYKIDDNLTVKAGTPVYINITGMHYDPNYFPEPEKFHPDRFLPENERNIKPYTYMPFGEGPRFCIGLRFAQMSLRYALSSILLNFKLHPVPDKPLPDNIKMDNRCLLFLPGEPLMVQFEPRHSRTI